MDSWLGVVGIVVLSAIVLAIYLTPSLIASGRRNETMIIWLNIFLGWTGIGWIALLVVALLSPDVEDDERETKPRKRKRNK